MIKEFYDLGKKIPDIKKIITEINKIMLKNSI